MKKRLFAAFVSLCIIMSMLPTMVFAEGVQDSGIVTSESGLCEHHTQHDESCGYTEGTAEIPCSHEHTEECHSLITRCVHAHTAECYTAEACRRMPTAYRRQRTQHRRNAFTRAPRKAAVSFKHQTASTRMTRIAAMHRLPWGSPAPIYVRFAIPRTEKRQCLCSGQPVPLPPNTPIRCITMPTVAAARRQVRAWTVRNFMYGFPYQK